MKARRTAALLVALGAIAISALTASGCSDSAGDSVDDTPRAGTPSTASATVPRASATVTRASATARIPNAATPTPAAATPVTATPSAGSVRPGPCGYDPCPTAVATTPPTPSAIGDDGVPRVPPLRALTFSAGEDLTSQDLYQRSADVAGHGRTGDGRGQFLGAALVIPSIGLDAPIETQIVGATGDMPEPTSMQVIAWYDFSLFPGLGGAPLRGWNAVMAANLGGVFAQLSGVQRGEILVLHLVDGRRLYYHVEFNKTAPRDSALWQDIVGGTADESMTLITAAGTGSLQNYSHRRIVWARRVNCELREAPETPTRAPYVECELPQ